MRLAVTLDLRDLVERLPTPAALGVGSINRRAGERLDDREHAAVAQVAVVRQSQHLATGLRFGLGHPLPQVARIVAAKRLLRGERFNQAGLRAVLTENDVAMQVIPA